VTPDDENSTLVTFGHIIIAVTMAIVVFALPVIILASTVKIDVGYVIIAIIAIFSLLFIVQLAFYLPALNRYGSAHDRRFYARRIFGERRFNGDREHTDRRQGERRQYY